ncbi:hypothetical protein NQ315_001564, partial [Exocentrus adspersus]
MVAMFCGAKLFRSLSFCDLDITYNFKLETTKLVLLLKYLCNEAVLTRAPDCDEVRLKPERNGEYRQFFCYKDAKTRKERSHQSIIILELVKSLRMRKEEFKAPRDAAKQSGWRQDRRTPFRNEY